jgi:hypothetical protein
MRRLTFDKARDLFPGAIEEWVAGVLELRQQDYADEREVLGHTVVWDDGGTLRLGWRIEGKANHTTTTWDSKRLEWADDVDTIEFMQEQVNGVRPLI